MLERWRSDRTFERQLAQRREPARRSGASTRGRRPRTASPAPITSSRASFKDIYPRYRTMRGNHVPRKAGWDCHGLPVELEVEKELGISSKAEIEAYGIAEFNAALPRVGVPLRRGLEPAHRADRLLDRPRRPLRHADQRLHRVGLVVAAADLGRRSASTRATRSSPTARAAARRSPRTRSRRATRTSRTRPSTCASRSPRRRRPTRSRSRPVEPGDSLRRLDDHAVDADLERGARGRPGDRVRARGPGRRRGPRRSHATSSSACSARTPRCSPLPGRGARGHALRAAVRLHHRLRPARPHGAARRLRHHRGGHRPRPHRDRVRRGRLPARRAVRDQAPEPGPARRHLRRAHHRLRGALRQGRRRRHRRGAARRTAGCCAPRSTSTPTRTAGAARRRCSTTRSRAGTSARPRSATGCWPRTRRSAGTPSTSSTAASASGSRATSTGRCRASATGARRCRSGSATAPTARSASAPARSPSCASAAARSPTTSTAPTSTRSSFACEACGGEMRRVEEVIDAWYDSGAMPFAQFHYPFEGEEEFEQRFPADYICEAMDQTRGWFYSLLAESVLLFDQTSYRNCVCLGLILDPEGQKMSKSRGNVVDPWRGDRRATAPTPSAGTCSPPSSRGPATASRPRPSASRCASSCSRSGTRTRSSSSTRTPRGSAPRRRRPTVAATTDLDRWALSRLQGADADGHRPHGRLRLHDGRAGDRRVRRRALQLVRAAQPAPFLGRRPGRVRDPAPLPARGRQAARPVRPLRRRRDLRQPRRGGRRAPSTSRDFPEPDPELEDGELEAGVEAVLRAIELGRAARAQAEGQGPPAAAQGGDRRHGGRAPRDRAALGASSRRSST